MFSHSSNARRTTWHDGGIAAKTAMVVVIVAKLPYILNWTELNLGYANTFSLLVFPALYYVTTCCWCLCSPRSCSSNHGQNQLVHFHDLLLDVADRLARVEVLRARLRAVHDRVAAV